MKTTTGGQGGRPMVMGSRGVVTSGHYLATEAGMHILRSGGNAVDAAAATGFALALMQPHQNGAAGEVPLLVYQARGGKVHAVSGHGIAPREATLDKMRSLGVDVIPGDGFLAAVVPATVGTWIRAVERFGTLRMEEILAPAIQYALRGFPMYDALSRSIEGAAPRFRAEWPTSAEVYLPGGRAPLPGELFRNLGWANTFLRLSDADKKHRRRASGFQAAYEVFYGEIGQEIATFARSTAVRDATGKTHTALLAASDFEAWEARFEDPVTASYAGIQVHKCGPWSQGPVLLQALRLVERAPLRSLGHNSAAYIHTVVECMKLAFADREVHYADPLFAQVPLAQLLSDEYTADRYALVDPKAASQVLRPGLAAGGRPIPPFAARDIRDVEGATRRAGSGDTTKLEVIDSEGNMVSATTSGGWLPTSPVIPGMGFCLGTRAQMFCLDASHPNHLEGGKRPRTTLTPSLATRGGKPYLSFGSPGGDQQDQWALQFFLNVVVFGMSLQEAVEAPTFCTLHMPSSFYPRVAEPGSLHLESRIPLEVQRELEGLGHHVTRTDAWSGGNTLAAGVDAASGLRHGAASPRLDPAYASAY